MTKPTNDAQKKDAPDDGTAVGSFVQSAGMGGIHVEFEEPVAENNEWCKFVSREEEDARLSAEPAREAQTKTLADDGPAVETDSNWTRNGAYVDMKNHEGPVVEVDMNWAQFVSREEEDARLRSEPAREEIASTASAPVGEGSGTGFVKSASMGGIHVEFEEPVAENNKWCKFVSREEEDARLRSEPAQMTEEGEKIFAERFLSKAPGQAFKPAKVSSPPGI